MNKYNQATKFYNHFVRLSDNKKEEFSRLANKLLSCNYICATRTKDSSDYYAIISNLEVFSCYFGLMDYVLEHHAVDKVVNLYNEQNYNHLAFKKNETIVLLILRKVYYQKMQEISLLDQITMTLEELHNEMITTGIFERRMNKTELKDILRLFKRFNMIDFTGQSDDDHTVLILYPTICYVLPIEKIEEVEKRLEEFTKRGEKDEETSEDETD